ncbi:MAG TPA: HypC/HybG/HupF family hydrogenase formation chaperone [Anaerolineaceae bacterium]|jgi:hydrogenase expression/formation protein HypC|nr:HypC/HybG/HupF family hydrogenase formation chaperone [Anaerolineaceae bacterium]HQF44218.1 HypC/HybG/HupF family hydrogenase formation chaperone [Anaerolineaceae bacterium]HQH34224.1 HypC/HybG/HupF family hydrogenase formation chaperone [Anaerolineaceae bacterium]HQJ03506.1 HypC/HybG/HupF family hydrogenase formation chaperone [Anaerolineaceae bacterium]
MCLGIPGKIIELYDQSGFLMGKVDFGGVLRECCFVGLPNAQVGQYAVIHAGFALNILSEEEARITIDALQEISDLASDSDAGNE